ncbi:hypothetical protein [Coleofasciculus sp. G2-EDA-02]|uniref:hypothetical protein n=1 Tax=Coleofasciculus sp. G2-EDA-02 TaxID=3069529 RepID=UPI0032FE8612
MTPVIPAHELTLAQVENQFNLRQVLDDSTFFPEAQDNLSELNDLEKQTLDRVKTEVAIADFCICYD